MSMWSSHDDGFNQSVSLKTNPLIQSTSQSLQRFQNEPNFSQSISEPFHENVQHQNSSSRFPHHEPIQTNVDETANSSLLIKRLIEKLNHLKVCVTEKVSNLLERNRIIERRMFSTLGPLGLNIESAYERFLANGQLFEDFKTELKKDFINLQSEQDKLLNMLQCGMSEIKWSLGSIKPGNDNFEVDPTLLLLVPKFDHVYKNYPTGFLKHFKVFVEITGIGPALQRLLFIYAVQLDNYIWSNHVANNDTFEGLIRPFLDLTWSKKHQTRVYLEFEKASFNNSPPEEISFEAKKWCDIVCDMEYVCFQNFRISLLEKLPRHWQHRLRVFKLYDFEKLKNGIDMCLENESAIPTVDYE